jgi:hypothetical protein
MLRKAVVAWGSLDGGAASRVIRAATPCGWEVVDVASDTDGIGADARDTFRDPYEAAVLSFANTVHGAAIVLAAVEAVLRGDLGLLVIVTPDEQRIWELLAFGEPDEIRAVMEAAGSGRLVLWKTFAGDGLATLLAERRPHD